MPVTWDDFKDEQKPKPAAVSWDDFVDPSTPAVSAPKAAAPVKPVPQPQTPMPTLRAAEPKGLVQRVKDSVLGSPETGETSIGRAFGYRFTAPNEQQQAPSDLPAIRTTAFIDKPKTGAPAAPVQSAARGVAEVAEGLTTPVNGLLMAGTAGTAGLARQAGATILPRLISAGFSADMIHSAAKQTPAIADAIHRGDTNEATRLLTTAGLQFGMGAAAGLHAKNGGRAPVVEEAKTEAAPAAAAPRLGEAAPHPVEATLKSGPVTWEDFSEQPTAAPAATRPVTWEDFQGTPEARDAAPGAAVTPEPRASTPEIPAPESLSAAAPSVGPEPGELPTAAKQARTDPPTWEDFQKPDVPAPYEPREVGDVDPNAYRNFRRIDALDEVKDRMAQNAVASAQETGRVPKDRMTRAELEGRMGQMTPEEIGGIHAPGRFEAQDIDKSQAAREMEVSLAKREVELVKQLNDSALVPEDRAALEQELSGVEAESRKWAEIVDKSRTQAGRGLAFWARMAGETWDGGYWRGRVRRTMGLPSGEKLPEPVERELNSLLREGQIAEQQAVADHQNGVEPPTDVALASDPSVLRKVQERLNGRKQALVEEIRKAGYFSGANLNAGLPLDAIPKVAELGAIHLANGVIDFGLWSQGMVKDLGEAVRPHLEELFEKAQDHLAHTFERESQPTAQRVARAIREKVSGKPAARSSLPREQLLAQFRRMTLARLQAEVQGPKQGAAPFRPEELAAVRNDPQVVQLREQLRTLRANAKPDRSREQLLEAALNRRLASLTARARPPLQGPSPLSEADRAAIEANPRVQKAKQQVEANRVQKPEPTRNDLMESAVQRNVKGAEETLARHGQPKPVGPRALTPVEREVVKNDSRVIAARRKLAQFMAKQETTGGLEGFDSTRKAAMLTGMGTHLTNMTANLGMVLTEEAARVPTALADMLLKPILSGQRTSSGASLSAMKTATMEAATRGAQEAKEILQHGATRADLAKMEVPREMNTGHTWLDKAVNLTFRSMSAEDRLYRVYAYRRSLEAQAEVIGKNRGMSPAEIEQLKRKPTPDMATEALADAEFATYNNENIAAKGLTEMIHGWKNKGAAGQALAYGTEFFLPFKNTPANVFARMLDYSGVSGVPKVATATARAVSHVRQAKAEGKPYDTSYLAAQQKVMAEAFGRGSIGTGILLMGYYAAKNGLATPARPDDASIRNAQEAAGRNWGMVKAGNQWVPIGRVFPLFTVGATLYFEGSRSIKDEAKRPERLASAMGKVLLDQPMLKGVSDVEEALKSPGSKGSMLVTSAAGTLAPSLLSGVGALTDGSRRDPRSDSLPKDVVNGIKSRLPVLRNTLPPKRDGLGRVMPQPSAAAFGAWGAERDRSSDSPVTRELLATRVGLPAINEMPGETREQYRQRSLLAGKLTNEYVTQVIASPSYRALTDPDLKSYLLKRAINAAHQQASAQWKAQKQTPSPLLKLTGRRY